MLEKHYPNRSFVPHIRDTDIITRVTNALDFYAVTEAERSSITHAMNTVLAEAGAYIFTAEEQITNMQRRFLGILKDSPHITVITTAVERAVEEMLRGLSGKREIAFSVGEHDPSDDAAFDPNHPLNAAIDACQSAAPRLLLTGTSAPVRGEAAPISPVLQNLAQQYYNQFSREFRKILTGTKSSYETHKKILRQHDEQMKKLANGKEPHSLIAPRKALNALNVVLQLTTCKSLMPGLYKKAKEEYQKVYDEFQRVYSLF